MLTTKFRRSLQAAFHRPYEIAGSFTCASTPVLTLPAGAAADVTISRNGAGDYTLTFSGSVGAIVACTATAQYTAFACATIQTATTSAVRIVNYAQTGSAQELGVINFRLLIKETA